MKITSTLFITTVFTIIAINACKSDNQERIAEETEQIKVLSIEDPWMRPANSGTNTALFFKIVNGTDKPDTLYGAESNLAEIVEVHETYQKGADVMGMRHVDMVEIPAGAIVEFKPRDLHVMLIRSVKDLAIADSGEVDLLFKEAGRVKVKAIVQDMPAMSETIN